MRFTKIFLGLALVSGLAGCLENDSERALAGAAAGAVVADALDTNVVAGAALGGLAGATCDDMGICY
ncbi:hypothetical protein OEW28_12650 [Defluviimonas sp. WL0002]|uniref:Glycine zipper 2TM domain-containing protein n=1 Tax=Albidovulum marisflavi TaxID=2984159 RepID=A0ABT2ZFD8_9RHOB|nr:hypothetical protein [Defluviimonas sp. WL0002]MCV2869476.1 hypothetical protein [Defluviimonas sp. WL0002]